MSDRFDLVYVAPNDVRAELPNRPARLLDALRARAEFGSVTVIRRRSPLRIGSFVAHRSLLIHTSIDPEFVAIEHPWPFGILEERWLEGFVRRAVQDTPRRVVMWICDPKSALVFARVRNVGAGRLIRVFDAYDAWDLSPLVRGGWRRRAVVNGYQRAARYADVVFANTEFMARRMRDLGARRVVVLPNAASFGNAPPGRTERTGGDPYLVYVGRIHERVDAELLATVADSFPNVAIRVIGPVERDPIGWSTFTARTNVTLEGPIVGPRLRELVAGASAMLLPHRVDEYTRSQDSMKAWDALAVGTPVIGTPVPPVDGWPAGVAVIAADAQGFIRGVRSALNGELEAGRDERIRLARANGWSDRAHTVASTMESVVRL